MADAPLAAAGTLPVLTLGAVLAAIAVRSLAPLPVPIWLIMLVGAATVLAGGALPPLAALQAIDWHLMLFLFGVLLLGQALVDSGCLARFGARALRFENPDVLLAAVLLLSASSSALLMNDTIAVMATPLVLRLAREHALPSGLLLLALAFGITTGSVTSPIGNPQNLLIALHGGLGDPFASFFGALALPTLLALAAAHVLLRIRYRGHFRRRRGQFPPLPPADPKLARAARWGLAVLVGGVLTVAVVGVVAPGRAPDLVWIGLAAAAPVLVLAPRRRKLLRAMDWHTLVFFAALFVLMDSVWRTGLAQHWLAQAGALQSLPTVFAAGIGLSQLISNVPLVSLYLPLLSGAGAAPDALLALAAASTLAGNLLIFGAASNVIIVQRAERDGARLGFLEFARVGVPLTLLQSLIYLAFLH